MHWKIDQMKSYFGGFAIKIEGGFIRAVMKNVENMNKILHFQQVNNQLQERVEFLQKRERDLLDSLMKVQKKK